jgi:hypothetical protein
MKIKKIILLVLSGLTLYLSYWTFDICLGLSRTGCANDSKMIFILTPLMFMIAGIFRILISIKTTVNLLYRIQDLLCGLLIFIPLFVNDARDSMTLGTIMCIIIIIFVLVEVLYLLFRKNLQQKN